MRPPGEKKRLWQRLLAGEIDIVASDHSPCLWEEKTAGDSDIFAAWGGISGLQSGLPAMLTEGVGRRGLGLAGLVRMMAAAPARLLGFDRQKGRLAPGADADLVLVDPEAEFTLQAEDLFYRNRHSAYVGTRFRGAVKKTISRGVIVYDDGRIVGPAGHGRRIDAAPPGWGGAKPGDTRRSG